MLSRFSVIHGKHPAPVVTRSGMFMLIGVYVGRREKDTIGGRVKFLSWVLTTILELLIQSGTRQPFMVSNTTGVRSFFFQVEPFIA